MTALSLRRLWTIYKRVAVAHGTCGKRDLAISQVALRRPSRPTASKSILDGPERAG
jgi:hypothetical protein